MQFLRSRKQKLTGGRKAELYSHSLQFYKYVPQLKITLEDFEKLALERLHVLRIIERIGSKSHRNSIEYKEMVINELRKNNLRLYFHRTVEDACESDAVYDERKRDHIAHFILRLAYCKSDFLRNWFLSQEVDLFRVRLLFEDGKQIKRFMELNQLDYKPIEKEEKKKVFDKLLASDFKSHASKVENANYYKVPFVEVLDLVKCRKGYLKNGYVYLHENDLVSILVSAFRTHLSHALALTARILPQLEEDRRLLNILNTIHVRYIGDDYSKKKIEFMGDVVPEMIDELAKTSFPLCMKNLHDTLRSTHHLKYFGRLQYGLFLKGIGLTVEDSMRFWREEFTKTIDVDKFEKRYAYGVRYNYGKEGRRANFTPYNCLKIITTNPPGPMDCHGCPFKHSDEDNLKHQLKKLQLGTTAVNNILEMKSKGHFQLACTRYFEATHNDATLDQGIEHPNKYFEESAKIRKNGNTAGDKVKSKVSTSRAVVFSQSDSTQSSTQPAQSSTQASESACNIDDFMMDDMEDLLKGI